MANTSYIDDSSDFTELWYHLDKTHIYATLASSESDVEEDITQSLPSAQSSILQSALNWGRERIDSILQEKYVMSDVTYSDALEMLKNWNARYAQWRLEKRKLRSTEACSEKLDEIDAEIIPYAKEKTVQSLSLTRESSPLSSTVISSATQFDSGGQFDNIMPSDEMDAVWPDRANS